MNRERPFELTIDTITRYVLQLPLEPGVTHDQLKTIINADPDSSEMAQMIRKDMAPLIRLRLGWFGYRGAVRAALNRNQVSADEPLQCAWNRSIAEDPKLARRVNTTARLFAPPAVATATMAACALLFFGVVMPTSLRSAGQTEQINLSSEGTRDVSISSSNEDTSKRIAWLFNPPDGALERAITESEAVSSRLPNDPLFQQLLARLYRRALSTPEGKTLIEAEKLSVYKTKLARIEEQQKRQSKKD